MALDLEIVEHQINDHYLVRPGPKLRLPEDRILTEREYPVGIIQMDREASTTFFSLVSGFVRPEDAKIPVLTHVVHYAGGAFEGVRIYESQYGPGFPNLPYNIARLFLSFTGVDASTSILLLEAAREGSILVPRRSDREIFEQVTDSMYNGREPQLSFEKIGDGKKVSWNWRISSITNTGELQEYSVFEVDALIKALAFANGLVGIDYYPNGLVMMESGYLRPHLWIDSSGGLGVPSVYLDRTTGELRIKPCAWSVSSLPWGPYLNEKAYEEGLEVLIGPFERLGQDFLTDRKIAAHYINSLLNVNVGAILGFGEILALNRTGDAVEGSAENLFVLFRGSGGKYTCYTPPIGDGPLAGTTRLRMIKALEKLRGQGLISQIIYQSLPPQELEKAEVVFFTGTGAQIIHVKSLCRIPELEQYVDAMRLRSETDRNGQSVVIPKLSEKDKVSKLINNGRKSDILDTIKKAYEQEVLEGARVLEPAYMIHKPEALATALRLDEIDVLTSKERRAVGQGYLKDRFDGRKGRHEQDEIEQRTRFAARIIARALQAKARGHKIFDFPLRRLKVA